MTATGHNDIAAQIAENLKRRHSTHTEVVKEALPADVAQRLEALEGMAQAVSDLSAKLADLLHTFNSHVHEPPPEMAELAKRVQALETLANRRAA